MKEEPSVFRRAWKQFLQIKLVDRFLIVVMIILILQAVIGLFTPFGDQNVTDRIDVVMRTTMASIFGYFVSSNFVKSDKSCSGVDEMPAHFQERRKSNIDEGKARLDQRNLQIRVVGTLCIFSIVILFCIRYFAYDDKDSLAYIFLFRDFVCGSIGFLIGMPTENSSGRSQK